VRIVKPVRRDGLAATAAGVTRGLIGVMPSNGLVHLLLSAPARPEQLA
jgi:hypothetical protein